MLNNQKRIRTFAAALVFTLSSSTVLHAQQPAVIARIGGLDLNIPAPDGLSEVSALAPEIKAFGERLTPPGGRLLALFAVDTAIRTYVTGSIDGPDVLHRFMVVHTPRELEWSFLADQGFFRLKEEFRQQLSGAGFIAQLHVENVVRSFEGSTRSPINLRVEDVLPMGVFEESATSLGAAFLVDFTATVGSERHSANVAIVLTLALVRGKVLSGGVYSVHRDDADLQWCREIFRAWLDRLRQQNK